MKVTELEFSNIRAMEVVRWALPNGQSSAGWHVILGDNGAGKTSFLRALAIGLIGQERASALWVDYTGWLRQGQEQGTISLHITPESADKTTGKGAKANSTGYALQLTLVRSKLGRVEVVARENATQKGFRSSWGNNPGWFSAGFGPFRRFTGSDGDYNKLFYKDPRLAAHLSLFRENVALTEALEWLQHLRLRSYEKKGDSFLTDLQELINQPDFLPHGTRMTDISSQGVTFQDANGAIVTTDELSDGFRSVLSLTFELLRQMQASYGNIFDRKDGAVRIKVPGVVLIDEIDAHLHPIWQKRIGYWFTKHFPKVQFFITTHSPLVCHAAENGSVFRLAQPGSDEISGMMTGVDLQRLLYGNVLESYDSGAFGDISTKSETGLKKTEDLATLNQKALAKDLTAQEKEQREKLRATLPISDSEDFVTKLLEGL